MGSNRILIVVVLAVTLAGCGPVSAPVTSTAGVPDEPATLTVDAVAAALTAAANEKLGSEPRAVVIVSPAEKIAQLVGDVDVETGAETQSLTETRYGLARTDLGVPFLHNGRIYVVFGDAWSPPDDPIAYTEDTNPEDGLALTFLQQSSGAYLPVTIPGVSLGGFEVPIEGTSVDGRMYIYATTDNSAAVTMGRSVVASSADDGYTFSYLYDLSTAKFINVSVVETDVTIPAGFPEEGEGLVLFGSGTYRESDVYLAFQPAAGIESRETLRYFAGTDAAGEPRWSAAEADAVGLLGSACVGELSVSYNTFLEKWVMLYNCEEAGLRGILMRTADEAWGPWSAPQVLFDPWSDGGYCHFMHVSRDYDDCDAVSDAGRETEWGGEYGPYQFDMLATGDEGQSTIYFTMSTWNPYTVVLMKATLGLGE